MSIERRKAPDLIGVLQPLYVQETTTKEELHVQERIFAKRNYYKSMSHFFDHLGCLAHDRRHSLMNRIVRLDGIPESKFDDVNVSRDVKPAIEFAHDRHAKVFAGYQAAIDSVVASKDHDVHKLLMKLHWQVDQIQSILEAVYEQAEDLGNNFLLKCIGRLPKVKGY